MKPQRSSGRSLKFLHFDEIDVIAGVESRGFLLAAPIADRMKKPLVLFRKSGKLPYKTKSASYDLEYGSSTIEIHEDSIKTKDRILHTNKNDPENREKTLKNAMKNSITSMMNTHEWHGVAPNDEQLQIALSQNPETLGDY